MPSYKWILHKLYSNLEFMNKPSVDDSLSDFNLQAPSTPFTDSISSIQWMPSTPSNSNPPQIFAATTWDGSLRIYEVVNNNNTGNINQKMCLNIGVPIQNCCWDSDNNTSISVACADGSIRSADLNSGTITQIGKHTDATNNVHYIHGKNIILSVGYDKKINFWQKGTPNPVFTYDCPDKIYVSDYANSIFAAATSQEKIMIHDINNFTNASSFQSYLQKGSQIQSLSLNPLAQTIGIGTIDGRANIVNIKKGNPFGASSFTFSSQLLFKSNKSDISGTSYMYPVNSVGFNIKNNKWFFTAGADGMTHLWNYDARTTIKSFNYQKTPITTAKVSPSGNLLAYGLGNDWHMGPEGIGKWQNKLAVHFLWDAEVKFALKNK